MNPMSWAGRLTGCWSTNAAVVVKEGFRSLVTQTMALSQDQAGALLLCAKRLRAMYLQRGTTQHGRHVVGSKTWSLR